MASKRRIRCKGCEGKKRHSTEAEARYHSACLYHSGDTNLNVYHCRFCRSYHVGHAPRQRITGRRP